MKITRRLSKLKKTKTYVDNNIVDAIREAIRKGEIISPIVVDTRDRVLDGHHRLAAMEAEGVEQAVVSRNFAL
jgi:ParB-like chromosome segregation protein Spo0J